MSVAPAAPAPSEAGTPSPASPPPESPAPEKKGATESTSDAAPTDLKVEPEVEKPLKVDPKVEPKPESKDKGESEFDIFELMDTDEKLKKSLKGKTQSEKAVLLKFLKDTGLLKVSVTLGSESIPNSPSELIKERRGAVQPVGAKTATGGFKVT